MVGARVVAACGRGNGHQVDDKRNQRVTWVRVCGECPDTITAQWQRGLAGTGFLPVPTLPSHGQRRAHYSWLHVWMQQGERLRQSFPYTVATVTVTMLPVCGQADEEPCRCPTHRCVPPYNPASNTE